MILRSPLLCLCLALSLLSQVPAAFAAPLANTTTLSIIAATSVQGRSALVSIGSHGQMATLLDAPIGDVISQPVRSPDGSHLAYVLNGNALWQSAANGRGARLLYALPQPTFRQISGPRYTADGKTLGFTVGCCGNFTLYRISAGGGGLRVISSGGVRIFQDWAPDGTHLLFTLNGQLWTADPYGHHPTPIGNDAATAGNFADARYSPDNSHIVASLLPAAGTVEGAGRVIALMHDDGRYLTILTATLGYDSTGPTWSPDGKLIAFVVASGAIGPQGRRHDLWVMRFNGRQRANLTRGSLGDVTTAVWGR